MQIFFHLKVIVYTNYGLFTEQKPKSKVHQLWSKIKDLSWAQTNSCFTIKTSFQVGQRDQKTSFIIFVYLLPQLYLLRSLITLRTFKFSKCDWPCGTHSGPACIEKHLSWQKENSILLPYKSWGNNMRLLTDLTT